MSLSARATRFTATPLELPMTSHQRVANPRADLARQE